MDELQMGPEPGGMKAAYSSLSPSGLCAAVMHGGLPGLPSFLHLVYLLEQGVSHPVSSLMGCWTGHAAWSPSGAHFLAAEVRQLALPAPSLLLRPWWATVEQPMPCARATAGPG